MGAAMPQKASFTEDDMMVREVFTDLVVNFARSGNVSLEGRSGSGGTSSPLSVPAFSGNSDDDGFLSISSKPKLSKGFR